MEINLSNNGFGNVGIGRNMPDAAPVDAKAEAKDTSRASHPTSFSVSNLSSREKPSGLASAEPVTAVSEEALVRDDALGKLVNAAFNLPPPPMPAFT